MQKGLARFHCDGCGCAAYRYDHIYERMMRESGHAWCIICTPVRYRRLLSTQELMDVSHTLIRQSHQKLEATQPYRTARPAIGDPRPLQVE
jgi:hypothetical protein